MGALPDERREVYDQRAQLSLSAAGARALTHPRVLGPSVAGGIAEPGADNINAGAIVPVHTDMSTISEIMPFHCRPLQSQPMSVVAASEEEHPLSADAAMNVWADSTMNLAKMATTFHQEHTVIGKLVGAQWPVEQRPPRAADKTELGFGGALKNGILVALQDLCKSCESSLAQIHIEDLVVVFDFVGDDGETDDIHTPLFAHVASGLSSTGGNEEMSNSYFLAPVPRRQSIEVGMLLQYKRNEYIDTPALHFHTGDFLPVGSLMHRTERGLVAELWRPQELPPKSDSTVRLRRLQVRQKHGDNFVVAVVCEEHQRVSMATLVSKVDPAAKAKGGAKADKFEWLSALQRNGRDKPTRVEDVPPAAPPQAPIPDEGGIEFAMGAMLAALDAELAAFAEDGATDGPVDDCSTDSEV